MNWASFSAAEPGLAATVEQRFRTFRHHVLATLRKDGSPRTSGLEADFRAGELWLGMMGGSLKALDLRRDPRFALQANPGEGTDMGGGDVRISGRAYEVGAGGTDEGATGGGDARAEGETGARADGEGDGEATGVADGATTKAWYAEEVAPPEPFHLFRTELTEVVRTWVGDDAYLVVQVWKPGEPLRTIRRR